MKRITDKKLLREYKTLLFIHPLQRSVDEWNKIIEFDHTLDFEENLHLVGLKDEYPRDRFFREKYISCNEKELKKAQKDLRMVYELIVDKETILNERKLNRDSDWQTLSKDYDINVSRIIRKEWTIIDSLIIEIKSKAEAQLLKKKNLINRFAITPTGPNEPRFEWISREKSYQYSGPSQDCYSFIKWFEYNIDEVSKEVYWSKLPANIPIAFKLLVNGDKSKPIMDVNEYGEIYPLDMESLSISNLDFGYGFSYEEDSAYFGRWDEFHKYKSLGFDISQIDEFFSIIKGQLFGNINVNQKPFQEWFINIDLGKLYF